MSINTAYIMCAVITSKKMEEIITLQVRVKIVYDETDIANRKEAIKESKKNVLGNRTYSGYYSTESLTAKLLK